MDKSNTISSNSDKGMAEKRKTQLIKGAVTLFKDKGFHRTATSEIAKFSGVSTGTLYEYIKSKEDILFLVCDSIYDRVYENMQPMIKEKKPSLSNLEKAIRNYFQIVDDMQDEVVVMYQELKSLPKEARHYVLKKENDMIEMLEAVIINNTETKIPEEEVKLIANNIFVQGQMWGFRRWMLQKDFSIDMYTDLQIKYLMNGLETIVMSEKEQ